MIVALGGVLDTRLTRHMRCAAYVVQVGAVAALHGPAMPGYGACSAGSGSGCHSSKPVGCWPPVPAAAGSQGKLAVLLIAGCAEGLRAAGS